jgi:RNA recognition motif-containing protein
MTKLFIGGLPYSFDNAKLNDLFTQFGNVLSASVVNDKFTGQSKGFGFVEMADDDAAQAAIKALDGSNLEGRTLGVSVARPREERSDNRSGGFRSNDRNGGGFNRNGGGNFRSNDRRDNRR